MPNCGSYVCCDDDDDDNFGILKIDDPTNALLVLIFATLLRGQLKTEK